MEMAALRARASVLLLRSIGFVVDGGGGGAGSWARRGRGFCELDCG